MKACPRVGVELTWKCNASCRQCFYLRNPNFHKAIDVPIADVKAQILRAKNNGLNHVNYVGFGEPTLCSYVVEITEWCREQGMATSMITNGLGSMSTYKALVDAGIDHFHISSHGTGAVLDSVLNHPGAFQKQAALKQYLNENKVPFRTNFSLQLENYKNLLETIDYEISMGVWHFVFLGFLPHYEWAGHVQEVAVHPADLRPLIEAGAEKLIAAGKYFTIRYQPLCHLSPKYWPYVTNARYVLYDPWEWNYTYRLGDIWAESAALGDQVRCQIPCDQCAAFQHCGGWNKTYADSFGGADLRPIVDSELSADYKARLQYPGGLFELNPVNILTGTIRGATLA